MENMDFGHVSTRSFVLMGIGAFIAIVVPIVIAIVWCRKKKEPFTTVLIGAAAFMLFAVTIEKAIQNVLIFPVQMGLQETAASAFINSRPVLLAFLLGLFPGVFEETGRLVAFKTVLRKRQQRETSISYGIGHGGIEVVAITGLTLISYIAMGLMINSGDIMKELEASLAKVDSPWMIKQVTDQLSQVAEFDVAALGVVLIERFFAVLFHIGGSIMVLYACKDKKWWLYPLAIIIHTLIDFMGALQIVGVISMSSWVFEIVFAVVSSATFLGSYLLLYRKDRVRGIGVCGEDNS